MEIEQTQCSDQDSTIFFLIEQSHSRMMLWLIASVLKKSSFWQSFVIFFSVAVIKENIFRGF